MTNFNIDNPGKVQEKYEEDIQELESETADIKVITKQRNYVLLVIGLIVTVFVIIICFLD